MIQQKTRVPEREKGNELAILISPDGGRREKGRDGEKEGGGCRRMRSYAVRYARNRRGASEAESRHQGRNESGAVPRALSAGGDDAF